MKEKKQPKNKPILEVSVKVFPDNTMRVAGPNGDQALTLNVLMDATRILVDRIVNEAKTYSLLGAIATAEDVEIKGDAGTKQAAEDAAEDGEVTEAVQ